MKKVGFMPTDLSRTDLILIIVCSVLAALLICACTVIIVFCLKRKKQQHKIDEFRYAPLDNEIKRYKKQREKYKNKLKNQDFVNYDVALNDMKVILDQELDEYKRDRLLSINQQINHDKNEILRDVILNSMQPLHLKIINESSVYYLPIDEKFKPLLIGKKGANIKKLNEITNCNNNVERDSKYIEISSPNPYSKQLAINTINHLLKSEAFDLNAIENVYKKETKVMRMNCIEIGKKYLDNLNINVGNSAIYEYVGRLRYR
ncbi:MAG: KH domain-containing protein [Mycoplasmoidaceae bacterium]|nr:KH domain-containing protein [Mycoplasmoidaceae bacterium]